MRGHIFYIVFFIIAFNSFAQNDSISNILKEVVVRGKKVTNGGVTVGQKSLRIGIKQLKKNPSNFTSLLRYNSPIALKDYGNGGVSTARFRGTSGSNTVVLWNGIQINSLGNGQVDFNSLPVSVSDEVIVNSGGGSAKYGSGVIGGAIHLNDNLNFKEHKNFQLFSSYGSFNTTSNFFKTNIGIGNVAIKLSSTINYSKNDYEYIDTRYKNSNEHLKNENGAYKNYGINFGIGYQFSKKNQLFFYTTGYYGDRLLSSGLPNPASGSERNEDFNQRNLVKWRYSFSKFTQLVNVSYLTQEYRYYTNKDTKRFNFGSSEQYGINYSLNYKFSNLLNVKYAMIYDWVKGKTNKILPKYRKVFSFLGEIIYKPTNTLTTAFNLRKELNSDFSVPLSLSLGATQQITDGISLQGNVSTNYRGPTFNELYWPIIGNLNLLPEKAIQGEIGIDFKNENIKISATAFYINTKDKILWLPTGGTNLWKPSNVADVINKGMEAFFDWQLKLNKHHIKLSSNYLFTIAKDKGSNTILPYVPKHLLNFNIDYRYKWLGMYVQSLYESKVYTNGINLDFYSLKELSVSNIGFNARVFNKKANKVSIGVKINNIFNEAYYFSNLRPMPGRNFNININHKF